jgi:TonB family protein
VEHGGRGFTLPASVLVEFVVTEDGTVVEPQVLESAGDVIDGACLRAVGDWRYEPARKDGVEVRVKQRARFTFRER